MRGNAGQRGLIKIPYDGNMFKTKNKGLSADFSLSLLGGWEGRVNPKQHD